MVFIKLQDDEIYSGGEPDKNLVRVVGAIRAGRDNSDKQLILKGINDVIKATASASLVEIRELEVGDEGGGGPIEESRDTHSSGLFVLTFSNLIYSLHSY